MFALTVPSLARLCIAMKFGIAMAARIPMITTTIISSISVKPFCDLVMITTPLKSSGCPSTVKGSTGSAFNPQSLCHVTTHLHHELRSLPGNELRVRPESGGPPGNVPDAGIFQPPAAASVRIATGSSRVLVALLHHVVVLAHAGPVLAGLLEA